MNPQPPPPPPPPPPSAIIRDAPALLRMSRGFSCLFWSMPLLSTAHAVAWRSLATPRGALALLLAGFAPLIVGLWLLQSGKQATPQMRTRTYILQLLAWAACFLTPFLAWWTSFPAQLYFAINAALYYIVMILLLAGLNSLGATCARELGHITLRRESRAGAMMVLCLGIATVIALAWLFQRSGILDAGLLVILGRLAQLPPEARALFILPYILTAYVMWRAKEAGLHLACPPTP